MVLTPCGSLGERESWDGYPDSFSETNGSRVRRYLVVDRSVGTNIKMFAWKEVRVEGDNCGETRTRRVATCLIRTHTGVILAGFLVRSVLVVRQGCEISEPKLFSEDFTAQVQPRNAKPERQT
jgi:hypothetical protein